MQDFDNNTKNVLITGASRGIGHAIAELLSQNNSYRVFGTTTKNLDFNHEEINTADLASVTKIQMITMDQKNISSINLAIEKINKITNNSGVDILINNAGINIDKLIMRVNEDDWDSIMNVNLKGCFWLSRLVSRGMIKKRYGKIINLGSIVGSTGNAGQSIYAASKAGLIGLTKSLAKELGSKNIQVNCIAPGFIETDMTDNINQAMKEQILQSIPLGRFGQAKEIAYLVDFLISDYASYITGAVLHINGGMY